MPSAINGGAVGPVALTTDLDQYFCISGNYSIGSGTRHTLAESSFTVKGLDVGETLAIRKLRINVFANTLSSACTFKLSVNGVDSALVAFTVPAGTSGVFDSGSGVEFVSNGDVVVIHCTRAAGGAMKFSSLQAESVIAGSNTQYSICGNSANFAGFAPGTPFEFCAVGGPQQDGESWMQVGLWGSGLVGYLQFRVQANTLVEDRIFSLAIDGVASAVTITVPAGATGDFISNVSAAYSGNKWLSILETGTASAGTLRIGPMQYVVRGENYQQSVLGGADPNYSFVSFRAGYTEDFFWGAGFGGFKTAPVGDPDGDWVVPSDGKVSTAWMSVIYWGDTPGTNDLPFVVRLCINGVPTTVRLDFATPISDPDWGPKGYEEDDTHEADVVAGDTISFKVEMLNPGDATVSVGTDMNVTAYGFIFEEDAPETPPPGGGGRVVAMVI